MRQNTLDFLILYHNAGGFVFLPRLLYMYNVTYPFKSNQNSLVKWNLICLKSI